MTQLNGTPWKELESDPGLFTLLIKDLGVKNIKVSEVFEIGNPIEGDVFGFILLFKWEETVKSRRKSHTTPKENFCTDGNVVNKMFFAKQIIPNSCATHALLSVLLNCNNLKLGNLLSRLKTETNNFTPEMKGEAISNMPEIMQAHSKHARPETNPFPESMQGDCSKNVSSTTAGEAFHFTCYLPINGHLFELDGLRNYPIDHGHLPKSGQWHDMARKVVSDRFRETSDFRMTLMIVQPCPIENMKNDLKKLQFAMEEVVEEISSPAYKETVTKLNLNTKVSSFKSFIDVFRLNFAENNLVKEKKETICKVKLLRPLLKALQDKIILPFITNKPLLKLTQKSKSYNEEMVVKEAVSAMEKLKAKMNLNLNEYKNELSTLERYVVEADRRTHDYTQFLFEFIAIAHHQGLLNEHIEHIFASKKRSATPLSKARKAKKKRK